jgi:long-chain acyl-CoA synthetase
VLDTAANVDEDDLFTYIYTSGTTGDPKACMIRHSNYYEMVAVVDELEDLTVADDLLLLYLPLAHNFGRLMHLAGPYVGYTIAFLPDPLRTAEALLEVRPTVLPSVPRVYEKVHSAVLAKFHEETGVKRWILDWALAVGYRVSALRQHGAPIPRGLELQRLLAERLVYDKVTERLGGRIRIAISGGAPLGKEVAEFFDALGVTILEGYGLTECTSAASVNRVSRYRLGTVGPALPGTELRLEEDGELLIRSPTVFAGYLKDEAATREILDDDGWLRSGDVAEIDEEGFVTITDRKKDILVTAGGKNVAPANIENDLKAHREISQALVIGDRRPFVAALVTLDPDTTSELNDEQKHARVEQIVEEANRDRSRFEQIKRFVILSRDFSMDEGEVTPTLKLKRRVVLDHFAPEIDSIYS